MEGIICFLSFPIFQIIFINFILIFNLLSSRFSGLYKKSYTKGMKLVFMISIYKEEAKALRENLPGVHIVRTVKGKSNRGRYYCEETRQVIKLLNALRNGKVVEERGV